MFQMFTVFVDSVGFQGTEWLLFRKPLFVFLEILVIQRCALQLLVLTAECLPLTESGKGSLT